MRRDLPPLPWERTRANLDDQRDHSTALRCRNGLSLHRPRDRRDFPSAEFRECPGAESWGGNISANKTAFSLGFFLLISLGELDLLGDARRTRASNLAGKPLLDEPHGMSSP